jgi:hypothetical protein
MIRSVQPFAVADAHDISPRDAPLAVLNRLVNTDKHRSLTVVRPGPTSLRWRHAPRPTNLVIEREVPTAPGFRPVIGQELLRVYGRRIIASDPIGKPITWGEDGTLVVEDGQAVEILMNDLRLQIRKLLADLTSLVSGDQST